MIGSHSQSLTSMRRGALLCLTVMLFCMTGLDGCASAPVQAMSDARQAIRAAQDAGAGTSAPEPLSEAQGLLNRAESNLNRRFFRAAREDAERAHAKAVEALHTARAEK